MKPITAQEVLPVTVYDRVRPRLRPLFIEEKSRRRLTVGKHITLLFENAQTVWYQIHEILRVERIFEDAAVNQEIETYNELLPKTGELSATMLIEYPEAGERDSALAHLVGLENHLWMVVDQRRVAAQFDPRQMSVEQISSVQFIRFPLGEDINAERFAQLAVEGGIAVEVDHPRMAARATIGETLAAALADDLRPE